MATNFATLLDGLFEVAGLKADHLRSNWQDERAARVYEDLAARLDEDRAAVEDSLRIRAYDQALDIEDLEDRVDASSFADVLRPLALDIDNKSEALGRRLLLTYCYAHNRGV